MLVPFLMTTTASANATGENERYMWWIMEIALLQPILLFFFNFIVHLLSHIDILLFL